MLMKGLGANAAIMYVLFMHFYFIMYIVKFSYFVLEFCFSTIQNMMVGLAQLMGFMFFGFTLG